MWKETHTHTHNLVMISIRMIITKHNLSFVPQAYDSEKMEIDVI